MTPLTPSDNSALPEVIAATLSGIEGRSREWSLPASLSELKECDAEMLNEILALFHTDTEERLQRLGDALSRRDYARLKKEAHSLKGSSGQLGVETMAALCQRIELHAESETVANLEALLAALHGEFGCVWQMMAAEIVAV